jgi:hypothetical protein
METKRNLKKMLTNAAAFAAVGMTLASCGGSSSSTSSYDLYTSPYITASGFVSALNNVDPYYVPANYLEKTEYETIRGQGFFVYYDGMYDEYVAVDKDYLRSIAYWDYYSSNSGLAQEFRDIQDDDEWDYGMIGDYYGDYYEIVDPIAYDSYYDEFIFEGVVSGNLYEDDEQVTDTGLMAAQKEEEAMFQKAASYSVAFKIPAKQALSLVTMEKEVTRMLKDASDGSLQDADKQAISKNIEHFTGKTMEEFEDAKQDPALREQLLEDVAEHIGTPQENLEDVILPTLLSIDL